MNDKDIEQTINFWESWLDQKKNANIGEFMIYGGRSLETCKEYLKLKQVAAEENNGWIKCSDRLPETTDYYWVTCKSSPRVIPPTYAKQMLWDVEFKTWQSGYVNADKYSNVIAWQPLAEPLQPYKEG